MCAINERLLLVRCVRCVAQVKQVKLVVSSLVNDVAAFPLSLSLCFRSLPCAVGDCCVSSVRPQQERERGREKGKLKVK